MDSDASNTAGNHVSLEEEAEALANCDRDPIHIPGYIQSFGGLIALSADIDEILYASENIEDFVGMSATDVLDADPWTVFSSDEIHSLRNLIGRSTAETQRELAGQFRHGEQQSAMTVHRRGDIAIVEFVDSTNASDRHRHMLTQLRLLTSMVGNATDLQQLLDSSVSILRAATGYDRVMVYRFRSDDSGEVIAESRRFSAEAFLGLRFPKYDIPPRARQLYLEAPIRMIGDVESASVPVIGKSGAGELDMSAALLRGTVPVHCQYLANMGVQASLSLPLIVDGRLWGLFALHHMSPHNLQNGDDLVVEVAAKYVSMAIQTLQERQLGESQARAVPFANSLVTMQQTNTATESNLRSIVAEMSTLLPCSGVAVVAQDRIVTHGQTPANRSIRDLIAITDDQRGSVFACESLAELLETTEGLGDVAGVLGFTVGAEMPLSLFFFRQNASSTVRWAGKPEKTLERVDGETRLMPRASFAAYEASVEGTCEEWEHSDVTVARGVLRALHISVPFLSTDRDRLADVVVQELNHRVRNVLALVQSIMDQSHPESADFNDTFSTFEQRILALAASYNALSDNTSVSGGSLPLDLRSTIRRGSQAFPEEQVILDGPPVRIRADTAPIILLILHELFSNAAKHGALSNSFGVVKITWQVRNDALHVTWSETGGPPTTKPERHGFGYTLIDNALDYQVPGSTTEMSFLPDGLLVEISLPEAAFSESEEPAHQPGPEAEPQFTGPVLSGNALVVEDDFLMAMQSQRSLRQLGASTVEAANSIDTALELLNSTTFEFAVLDINLGGTRSGAVATQLRNLGVPFLFLTGYDSNLGWLNDFDNVAVLRKPVGRDEFKIAVQRAVTG